jgi:hypothetical protein
MIDQPEASYYDSEEEFYQAVCVSAIGHICRYQNQEGYAIHAREWGMATETFTEVCLGWLKEQGYSCTKDPA